MYKCQRDLPHKKTSRMKQFMYRCRYTAVSFFLMLTVIFSFLERLRPWT